MAAHWNHGVNHWAGVGKQHARLHAELLVRLLEPRDALAMRGIARAAGAATAGAASALLLQRAEHRQRVAEPARRARDVAALDAQRDEACASCAIGGGGARPGASPRDTLVPSGHLPLPLDTLVPAGELPLPLRTLGPPSDLRFPSTASDGYAP